MRRYVFLDRDGTLVRDNGYGTGIRTSFVLLPGVREGLSLLVDRGFVPVIVTNQSAVARGIITKQQLDIAHEALQQLLGLRLEVLSCIHTDWDRCDCRKPQIGLVRHLLSDVAVSDSWMIGDKLSDAYFATCLGVRCVLLRSTYWQTVPDGVKIADSFSEAVARMLSEVNHGEEKKINEGPHAVA